MRRVTLLTPRMVRITFGGEQMAGFESKGPAEHIRVYMPDSETGEFLLPVMGPEGYAFPEDRQQPATRAYTVRPVGLRDARVGHRHRSSRRGPRSRMGRGSEGGRHRRHHRTSHEDLLPRHGRRLVSHRRRRGGGCPAIGTLLEGAALLHTRLRPGGGAGRGRGAGGLESAAALQLRWLHRQEGETPGRALAAAMREAELPKGKGFVWVTCEAAIMREIRRHFIEERGLDRSMLRMQGYWKAGAVDYHDKGGDL